MLKVELIAYKRFVVLFKHLVYVVDFQLIRTLDSFESIDSSMKS